MPSLHAPHPSSPCPATAGVVRRPAESGFGFIELLIAAMIGGLALLIHAGSVLAGHRLASTQESRTVAIQTLREFVARARSDEDWAGLYDRYLLLGESAVEAGEAGLPLDAWYADIEVPAALGEARMMVTLPSSPQAALEDGTVPDGDVLREDVADATYGLPYDLNGDGVIDDEPRDDDYRALPAVFTLTWAGAGEIPQSLRFATWLTGER